MATLIAAVSQPIQLLAFTLLIVAGLLRKFWKSKIGTRLFYIFLFMAITTFLCGLYMTWQQFEKPAIHSSPGSVVQSSSGDNSPNVNSSGSGSVTVQSGNNETNSPSKPPKKKQ
jgi:energy-coupling factor transporter transmembrane protein EcfT